MLNRKNNNGDQSQKVEVRQNMLKLTQEYSSQLGKPFTLIDIIRISNVLIDYCMNGYDKNIGERAKSADEHIKSLFEEI